MAETRLSLVMEMLIPLALGLILIAAGRVVATLDSRILDRYATHYNHHRPHRPLQQRAPAKTGTTRRPTATTRLRRKTIRGGLINEYRHAA